MSILIVGLGDPHFKSNNEFSTGILHSSFINFLISQKKKNKIIDVVVEGDLLDRFESINVHAFNRAINFIDDIRKNCRHVYLLIGNHDRPNNSVFLTNEHPFNALKKWEKITVVDKVIIDTLTAENKRIANEDDDEDNDDEDEEREISAEFVFIPYVPVGKLREALLTVSLDHPIENPNLNEEGWERLKNMAGGFSHQEYYGAKLGICKSINGDIWPTDGPFMVSGHIHNEEYLQPNLHYTGTPMQHGYDDISNKTISLYNYSKVGNRWQMIKEEKIDLKVPKKIHIKLTKEELLNFKVIENASIIRIDIEIDITEFKELKKNKKIKQLIDNGVKIKPINTRKQIGKNEIGKISAIKMSYTQRLGKAINESEIEVKTTFEGLFGVLDIKKNIPKIKIKNTPNSENSKRIKIKLNNRKK